jgi:hypothetical protein
MAPLLPTGLSALSPETAAPAGWVRHDQKPEALRDNYNLLQRTHLLSRASPVAVVDFPAAKN